MQKAQYQNQAGFGQYVVITYQTNDNLQITPAT